MVCSDGSNPAVAPGFVRIVPQPASVDRIAVRLRQHGVIMKCRGGALCNGAPDALNASCVANFEGYLCESCAANHFMDKQNDTHRKCIKCAEADIMSTVIALLAIFGFILLVGYALWKITRGLTDAEHLALVAIFKALWQPLRTMVTYAQVNSQLVEVISISLDLPPVFKSVMNRLREWTKVFGAVAGECVGLGSFWQSWLVSVVVQPMIFVTIVLLIYMYQRSRSAIAAKANLFENGFFALFLAYPGVCASAFSAWTCIHVLDEPEFSILAADDRVS